MQYIDFEWWINNMLVFEYLKFRSAAASSRPERLFSAYNLVFLSAHKKSKCSFY